MNQKTFNFPLTLTITRLVIAPVLLPFLIVYLLPANELAYNLFVAGVFMLFGATDFFDGYLARRYKQETALGKLLDPIADKFCMFSTFIALVAIHKLYFYWAIIFIGREFFVMGLREIALIHNFSVPVMSTGKIKTAVQMIYIAFVIANPYHGLLCVAPWINGLESIVLAVALFYTVYSAVTYYRVFMRQYLVRMR